MLILRLKRVGKKHQAGFRLVVGERRSKLQGKNVEDLGWYNPHTNQRDFNAERVDYWLKIGAKPSDTVHNLLVSAGIIKGVKIPVHKKPKAAKEQVAAAPAAAQPATS